MKITGRTDTEDYHIRTLLWMLRQWDAYECGVDWKDWRLSWLYTWYDGPIWQLCIGPFWVALGTWPKLRK